MSNRMYTQAEVEEAVERTLEDDRRRGEVAVAKLRNEIELLGEAIERVAENNRALEQAA